MPLVPVTRRRRRFMRTHVRLIIGVVAIGVVIVGIVGARIYDRQSSSKTATKPMPQPSIHVIKTSTSKPSESAVAAKNYVWSGNAKDPKTIIIPSLHINALIQPMDLDRQHQIATPTNILLAGWYIHSAQPGQKGLSIIEGHLNGAVSSHGLFEHLAQLTVGDTFSVQLGDGSQRNYSVMATTTVPLEQAASVLFSQDPSTPSQLNLITCGGVYNKSTGHYLSRTVVSARLLPGAS